MLSAGVAALSANDQAAVLDKVRTFAAFDGGNDPHGEHDLVTVEHDSDTYFGKLDYYDAEMHHGSEDPSYPARTTRVLTIMRADEY